MRIRPRKLGSSLGIPRDWSRICSFSHPGIPPMGTSSLVTQCSAGGNGSSPSVGHARRWLLNPLPLPSASLGVDVAFSGQTQQAYTREWRLQELAENSQCRKFASRLPIQLSNHLRPKFWAVPEVWSHFGWALCLLPHGERGCSSPSRCFLRGI